MKETTNAVLLARATFDRARTLLGTLLLSCALVTGAGMFTALTASAARAAGHEPGIHASPTVNINAATAAELSESLTGVGTSKAQAIVAYRKKHGPFHKVSDLAMVKGIGPATVAKNRKRIRLK